MDLVDGLDFTAFEEGALVRYVFYDAGITALRALIKTHIDYLVFGPAVLVEKNDLVAL